MQKKGGKQKQDYFDLEIDFLLEKVYLDIKYEDEKYCNILVNKSIMEMEDKCDILLFQPSNNVGGVVVEYEAIIFMDKTLIKCWFNSERLCTFCQTLGTFHDSIEIDFN